MEDIAMLKERLLYQRANGWQRISEKEGQKAMAFAKGYMDYLNQAKTEREAIGAAVELLVQNGFVPFEAEMCYQPGDRIYQLIRGKALIAGVIGSQPLEEGIRMVAAHVDAPRLDLKQNPLYEAEELAYFKTHYYGGIRKYQWPTVPLALHGVVCLKDGNTVEVVIGEQEDDPRFVVTDLLPHLGQEQNKRTLAEGIRGEELNVLIGSRPFQGDDQSELVKLNILHILHEKYHIIEEDFLSAELEVVPAGKAMDIGLDRSMIGGYGQDDRVCVYPALMALVDMDYPKQTVITVLADKEETGSDGNTGLKSNYLQYFVEDLAMGMGANPRRVLTRSTCLSADVTAAYDPTFAEPFEKRNSSFLNYGAAIKKFTGARGKYDTSDASAELVGMIRSKMDAAGVIWQTGELGKVDFGGGGTVAKYVANLGVDVLDIGVPVLCMHAPFEVVSKLDLYMMYRAVTVFYQF